MPDLPTHVATAAPGLVVAALLLAHAPSLAAQHLAALDRPTAGLPLHVALVDADGDGLTDAFTWLRDLDTGLGRLERLPGLADGGLGLPATILDTGTTFAATLWAGDADGDGDADLFAEPLGLLLNDGLGTFGAPQLLPPLPLPVRHVPARGDLNEDGLVDWVGFTLGGHVRVSVGGGVYVDAGKLLPPAPQFVNVSSGVMGDFDEDGHLDVVMADSLLAGRWFFAGDGLGGFAQGIDVAPGQAGAWSPQCLAAVDVDDDGHLDLLGLVPGAPDLTLNRGLGDGSLAPATPLLAPPLPDGWTRAALLATDLDDDGHVDAVLIGSDPGGSVGTVVFRNDGAGDLSSTSTHAVADGGTLIAVGDLGLGARPTLAIVGAGDGGPRLTLVASADTPFVPLAHGAAGGAALRVRGSPQPGLAIELSVDDASGPALVVVGLVAGLAPTPHGLLVPHPDVVLTIAPRATATLRWPDDLLPTSTVLIQAFTAASGLGLVVGIVSG